MKPIPRTPSTIEVTIESMLRVQKPPSGLTGLAKKLR
jgi:hypothetical protein